MRGKEKTPGRGRNVGLWILAFVLMLSAGVSGTSPRLAQEQEQGKLASAGP